MSHPFTMPTIPAGLAAKITADRKLFAGWTMTATPPESAPPENDEPPLREPGLKALQVEREAREKAEQYLADFVAATPDAKSVIAERDARQAAEARATALEKQIADSKLTAEEKASADLKAAQDMAATATLTALKYEVAAAAGIDIKLAARLTGATKADLEADAVQFKALIPGAKPGAPAADRSQGRGGAGGTVTGVTAGRDLFRDSRKTPDKTL